MHSEYLISAPTSDLLPTYDLPELAFVGRSNCGKSTLLNALLNHKGLARTSRTPGRTQMVNFFRLDKKLILADLPGYGFSATGKATREHWQELMTKYFERKNLRFVLFLSDIRRELDEEDYELMQFLAKQHPVVLVLTKSDKLTRPQILNAQKSIENAVSKAKVKIHSTYAVSSTKKNNIDELRSFCVST